jgi:maltooligosyltrehalose trehalohydrolase
MLPLRLDPWKPTLGAVAQPWGATFRVWAPAARRVEAVILEESSPRASARPGPGGGFPLGTQEQVQTGDARPATARELASEGDGIFSGKVEGAVAGTRYWFRLDGSRLLPDPASRFQPEGVHGPSQIVGPDAFSWSDADWVAPEMPSLSVYELHVGAFSPAGSFAGVEERLPAIAALGVSAIELMPVAEFPGRRNWGYDGVDLFAPSHRYGTPDDLRRLVNAAHRHGLAVILDVVYNHLGPDGAYLSAFSPFYFTDRHKSPWGDGVNLDGPHSEQVRAFFIENALHWLHEYHVDGLRLDATHALQDDGSHHFLAELASTIRAEARGRGVVLIAEDERNCDRLVRPADAGGFGLDGVWSDDFHHQCRRLLAGDHEGYYANFSGTAGDLATTIQRGWFFMGQAAPATGAPRGSDPAGIPLPRFVFCLQNHDQVGNRAFGERLHHQIDLAAYRSASALLLCAPETPLLFMGQEWAASSPFLYFTDHEEELGRMVTEGRRAEFLAFSAFADPARREQIPDPQADSTFERSRLPWDERDAMPHAGVRRLYERLVHLRRSEPALTSRVSDPGRKIAATRASAPDEGTVVLRRQARSGPDVLVVARLRGEGRVDVTDPLSADAHWELVLTTEDPDFAEDGQPPGLEWAPGRLAVVFERPSAVVLRRRSE